MGERVCIRNIPNAWPGRPWIDLGRLMIAGVKGSRMLDRVEIAIRNCEANAMLLLHAMVDAKLADIDREFGPIVEGRVELRAPPLPSEGNDTCQICVELSLPGRYSLKEFQTAANDKDHIQLAVATNEMFKLLRSKLKEAIITFEPIYA